ncbi:MAG: S1C family serine protease [Ignisphaera sp.]|uniref:PDZ domain-containing protein n=1 Tax=Ignisphaera aggregans TaxID=334771 RepID=A0A7J3MX99_9CREN
MNNRDIANDLFKGNVVTVLNKWIVSIISKTLNSLYIVSIPRDYSCRNGYEFEHFATGFAINRDIVVSVAHIEPKDHVCVIDSNGESSEGRVKGIDNRWDLLFIESNRVLDPLSLELEVPPIGSIVLACGMPLGLLRPFFSLGIISGHKINAAIGNEYIEGLLTASAPVIPGMSGGPLIDIYGKAVGIITGSAFNTHEFTLIVPSKRIYYSYNILKKYGYIDHIKLGIRVIEYRFGSKEGIEGVVVSSILNNKLSSICGISVGDIIVAIDNFKIKTIEDLWNALDEVFLLSKDRIVIEFYSYKEKTYRVCEYNM